MDIDYLLYQIKINILMFGGLIAVSYLPRTIMESMGIPWPYDNIVPMLP